MRLWSLHPGYLDASGLTAQWREGLLAQAVLAGRTRGYTQHPQLTRWRATPDPLGALASFLDGIHAESLARDYRFDPTRIDAVDRWPGLVEVTAGQVAFEREHLLAKLRERSPEHAPVLQADADARVHPLFRVVPGPIADWERAG